MLLKATVERNIDMEEVLETFLNYDSDISQWWADYRDMLGNMDTEDAIVLEQNAATVIKACIDLYIERLRIYRDKTLNEEIRLNPI